MADKLRDIGGAKPLHVGQLNLPDWDDFEAAFRGIFERRFFANHGPLERELDRALAEYLGVRHVVSVVNGTVGLMLAARALDIRGEVIVPAFTFPATVQILTWAGLRPRFCDVDPVTHTLAASLVEPLVTESTGGILGVHLWGRACDPCGLQAVARRHGLKLFFDAAHGVGCTFGGVRIGGFGDAEVLSFHATKVLNGAEGGCICTNDDDLARRIRTMRSFHESETQAQVPIRMNGKISEAQAAMALLSLAQLPANIAANRRRYLRYQKRLRSIPGVLFVDFAGNEESNYQYVVIAVDPTTSPLPRDAIVQRLETFNIHARDYFSPGVQRMAPYREQFPELQESFPVTDRLARTLIQLPTGQAVTEEDVDFVCDVLEGIMEGGPCGSA